jgi:hypothetical protein
MGAFETFVNANLGIRKPLISDIGPPSGSSKAAGIIGSEYIDTDSNFLYEKTGENNLSDWVFTRKLGDQSKDEELENSVSIISGNLQALDDSIHSSSFSLPSGASEVSIKYSDLGVVGSYSQNPDINISMISQSSSPPLSYYSHMIYGVSLTGFNVSFSSDISELDLSLGVLLKGSM